MLLIQIKLMYLPKAMFMALAIFLCSINDVVRTVLTRVGSPQEKGSHIAMGVGAFP